MSLPRKILLFSALLFPLLILMPKLGFAPPPRPPLFMWESNQMDEDGNWNDVYQDDLISGAPYPVYALIYNSGEELLVVEVSTDHDAFTVEPTNFEVETNHELQITVTFEAPEPGNYEANLILHTNYEEYDEIRIPMVADAYAPPEMRVIGEDIDELPWQGEVIEHEITIANDGGSPLRFTIDIENEDQPNRDVSQRSLRSVDGNASQPLRDDPIAEFNGNNGGGQYCSAVGWDWDNEGMWVSNYSVANAVRWGHDENYENFEEQCRINPGNCMDGAWAKGYLYLPTWASQQVNRYNEEGQNIGAINMGFPVYGMAADVENDWLFFLNPHDNMAIYVYELTDNGGLGDQIGVIRNHMQFHGNAQAYNLEWVPKHPDGQLWMTNYQNGRVHQIAVDTEDWQCTGSVQNFAVFPQADQPYCAVAHDGHNLWAAGYHPNNIRIYDDGVAEANWLAVAPREGIVDPDGEQIITVTLDTHGLLGGEYTAELHIRSNDPENPEHVINIEMTGNDWHQEEEPPRIEVSPDSLYNGEEFLVRNVGGSTLVVDSMAIFDYSAEYFFSPFQFSLEPGEEQVVDIDILFMDDRGYHYFTDIEIFSNDPENPEITIVAEFYLSDPFLPQPTNFYHNVLVTALEFDGEPVDPGWEIGVFTPNGVFCGHAVWRGEQEGISVYGADNDERDYFHDGELMTILGWDNEADLEYPMYTHLEEGDLYWHNEGLTILSLEANTLKQQTIALRAGWNFVSLNVSPVDQNLFAGDPGPEVIPMLAQLQRPNNGAHHVVRFKDFIGRFYSPGNGFNNIPFWNLQQGYMLLVDEPLEVVWQGSPIDAQADIPLREGWNIAPYYPDYQLSASQATNNYVLSPIIDNVLIAKDVNGRFMIPSRNFFSNMIPWREGQAYQIKVSQAVTLNYPQAQNEMAGGMAHRGQPTDADLSSTLSPHGQPAEADRASTLPHFHPVSLTGANMSLLLTLIPAKAGIHSAEIGIFTPSDLCVGASSFQSPNSELQIGVAVWGDDPSTPEIDGALEGEPLTLQFWPGEDRHSCLSIIGEDRHSCLSQSIHSCLSLNSSSLSYETDGFAEATLELPDASQLSSFIFQLSPPSPNPFNSTTRTKFSLAEPGHVKLGLYEPSGRLVQNILEGDYASGEHESLIDGNSLPAGVYFIRLETAGAAQLQKIVLTR